MVKYNLKHTQNNRQDRGVVNLHQVYSKISLSIENRYETYIKIFWYLKIYLVSRGLRGGSPHSTPRVLADTQSGPRRGEPEQQWRRAV